jgi:hypothetical protein
VDFFFQRKKQQCNFFLLFAFPKGDFFPEGNKLPFGDEKNSPSGTAIPFASGKRRGTKEITLFYFFFFPRRGTKVNKTLTLTMFPLGKLLLRFIQEIIR